MYVARQQRRGGGDRNRSLGDRRLAADSLGGTIGRPKNRFAGRTDHIGPVRQVMALFDLAEDLGFADHLALERSGECKEMAERVHALAAEALRNQLGGGQPRVVGQSLEQRLGRGRRIVHHHQEFEALTGRNDNRLAHPGGAHPGEEFGLIRLTGQKPIP